MLRKTILSRLKYVHSRIYTPSVIIKIHNFKGSKYSIPLGSGCSFMVQGVWWQIQQKEFLPEPCTPVYVL